MLRFHHWPWIGYSTQTRFAPIDTAGPRSTTNIWLITVVQEFEVLIYACVDAIIALTRFTLLTPQSQGSWTPARSMAGDQIKLLAIQTTWVAVATRDEATTSRAMPVLGLWSLHFLVDSLGSCGDFSYFPRFVNVVAEWRRAITKQTWWLMYISMTISSSETSKRSTFSWWRARCLLNPPICKYTLVLLLFEYNLDLEDSQNVAWCTLRLQDAHKVKEYFWLFHHCNIA